MAPCGKTAVEITDGTVTLEPDVDIVEGEDGYRLLEVNPTAGFRGLFKTTGRSPAPHIARLAIERAGDGVEPERVHDPTANLDDARTNIDAHLAAEIGTRPTKDIVKTKSGSVKSGCSRPVVDPVVGVGGKRHTVSASIEDRFHLKYPLLLGRDIVEHYHVDVRRQADEGEPPAIEETALEE